MLLIIACQEQIKKKDFLLGSVFIVYGYKQFKCAHNNYKPCHRQVLCRSEFCQVNIYSFFQHVSKLLYFLSCDKNIVCYRFVFLPSLYLPLSVTSDSYLTGFLQYMYVLFLQQTLKFVTQKVISLPLIKVEDHLRKHAAAPQSSINFYLVIIYKNDLQKSNLGIETSQPTLR